MDLFDRQRQAQQQMPMQAPMQLPMQGAAPMGQTPMAGFNPFANISKANGGPGIFPIMDVLGTGLQQMDRGAPVNVAPVVDRYQAQKKAEEQKEQMKSAVQAMREQMSPVQWATFKKMPEPLQMQLIMQMVQQQFAPPKVPDPVKGVEVNGNLVNPITGEVIYQGGQKPEMKWIDGIGMVDMNNPPSELAAGTYQPPAEEPDLTSGLKEYEYAVSRGYTGSFMDYQRDLKEAGRSSTNVTVGGNKVPGLPEAPKGFTYLYTPDGDLRVDENGMPMMGVVPGGPADQEQKDLAEKERGRDAQVKRAGGTVVQDLNRALQLLPELGVLSQNEGVVGGVSRTGAAKVPGTVANRITQFTESALSNVGLDTLQQMRENSPTGGALGQVPIQQQKRLEQVLGSLNINQPPSVQEANIKRVINIYNDIMYGDATERAQAVREGKITPEQSAEIDTYYYDLPFDSQGLPVESGGMTFEQFQNDPGVIKAAKGDADLIRRMWEIKQEGLNGG